MIRIPVRVGIVGITLAVGTLAACELVDKAEEIFDGLTNPLVGVALILGADVPDGVDLSAAGVEDGVVATVFLADVADPRNLDGAPVSGATVEVEGGAAVEEEEGLYVAYPEVLPDYTPNDEWTVTATRGDSTASMKVTLPPAASVDVPADHTVDTPITLDVTGQDFDAVVVVVVESSTQEVTWTNGPDTAQAVYDLVTGGQPVASFEVPGEAFPSEDLYLLGVAGLRRGDAAGVSGANAALTTLTAGKMAFHDVDTRP